MPLEIGLHPNGKLRPYGAEKPHAPRFEKNDAAALLALTGALKADASTPSTVLYWRMIAGALWNALCRLPGESRDIGALEAPSPALFSQWVLQAPPMTGGEYLSSAVLASLWARMETWAKAQIHATGNLASFLAATAPAWSQVGRVTLHLAENKGDPEYPFAFMATYSSGMSTEGRMVQLPLGRALEEYGNKADKLALLKLLEPLQRASRELPLITSLIESGDIYHPLAWTAEEALVFLRSIPACQASGLLVRVPNWWRKRSRRPQVVARVGDREESRLSAKALLSFRFTVTVNGQELTPDEVAHLLRQGEGLVFFRGQWVEVEPEKLQQALDHWSRLAADGEISFPEAMRLLAESSAPQSDEDDDTGNSGDDGSAWAFAQAGDWLNETLSQLAKPKAEPVPGGLRATLRPYQKRGLNWLWFCAQTGLGACLADDMGLGKTVQVLAALQRKKERAPDAPAALLIVPTSLLGNWKREAARFAPELRLRVLHRSEGPDAVGELTAEELAQTDLVMSTYGQLTRQDWLRTIHWGWVILDEAQAIKNAESRQSKAARQLRGDARFALTGTPVENNLGDLWSLFDFINPGLLGSARHFQTFARQLREGQRSNFAPLRRLVGPYILRRLKTDPTIISDLPEKTEMKVFCGLTPTQARLYERIAAKFAHDLEHTEGMQRRGLTLAALMRFKQVCNHPDLVLGETQFSPSESAKFGRLGSLCEEMAARGEKVLVFTQFREMTEPLTDHLAGIFGRRGLVLHGGTPTKKRAQLVEEFQTESGPPFFVLSLKAGGTGLNLTAASHVVHFDRWWNPAVENQATDRAFRIGQKRNVLVHKFITSGTLEERIDRLISDKQETAEAILSEGAEKMLTEMSRDELLDFVRLDLTQSSFST